MARLAVATLTPALSLGGRGSGALPGFLDSCYHSGDVAPPFAKILIANRGEIAVRVIRACREMGIQSVAVFSEADRESLHVMMADEAVLLGPPPAAESYLSIDRIIAAARDRGAEAIHPGYGFLAENAEFAQACAAAGLVFIGPPAPAIRSMGDKIAARKVAIQMNVPVVPGTDAPLADEGEAARRAGEIGFPIMLKAARGRRRQGHAPRPRPGRARGGAARRAVGGRGGLRRRVGVHRALRRGAAPHRGPDPGRRPRPRGAPRRARVLDPAPPPEAHRGEPVVVRGCRPSSPDGRGCRAGRHRRRIRQRGDRGVPGRRRAGASTSSR